MRTDDRVNQAGARVIASDDKEVEALRAEVTKWQERVPKLASVMRERTQELESLKVRNANLAETTEFASQQIEFLSGQLSRIAEQNDHQQNVLVLQHEQRECELTCEVQRLNDCIEQAQHSHAQLERERRALAEKVATLEQALREKLSRSRPRADLTVLKGVGVKVAEQLAGRGYGTLEAIAGLEISDLDDEDHPLHSFKSRMARDDWIGHAKEALED